MSTLFNTDISTYTISELMAIANIDEMEEDEIIKKTNEFITQYQKSKKNVAEFFRNIQLKLLDYIQLNNYENDKNNHVYISNVDRDVLNPLLNQTETRVIILNSHNLTDGNIQKTNYVANLNSPLKNVINIRLHSYTIPYTWYNIDSHLNNFFFYVKQSTDNTEYQKISIPFGNYTTIDLLLLQIQQQYNQIQFTYSTINGKITIRSNVLILSEILFFDPTHKIYYEQNDQLINNSIYRNSSLGWLLGFRQDKITLDNENNFQYIAESPVSLYGTRSLYLILDDFKRNRISNNITSIVEMDQNIKLPDYYTSNIPYECNADKIVNVVPSIPRTLTNSQIYTINEILNNKNKNNYYAKSPNDSDILAILPIKTNGLIMNDILIETNGQLQDNKREYYGPVNIERIGVKLLDDLGNVMNLNGADWSITLLYESLYQY